MKRKRRHLTAEFKARVALEALKGVKTAAEIARENDIAPAQISEWKKQLEERLGDAFESKGERSKELQIQERKEARLERKIGQLVIEKDFLVKSASSWGSIRTKSHDREAPFPAVGAQAVPTCSPSTATGSRPANRSRSRETKPS